MIDLKKLREKATYRAGRMKWKVTFAVGIGWVRTVTVRVPCGPAKHWEDLTQAEFDDICRRGIQIDKVIGEAVKLARHELDRRAERANQEAPVAWDLALLSVELS